jgi:glucose-1-phosphate cytidylyltransferase
MVRNFQEKPAGDGAWINGGFFVLEPGVLAYIDGDDTVWEQEPLQQLTLAGQLSAYQHKGFWQAMDTLRDQKQLEELYSSGKAPWKTISTVPRSWRIPCRNGEKRICCRSLPPMFRKPAP